MLFALLPVVVTRAVRPEARGRAMSIALTLGPLGSVAGPVVGGVLVDTWGWPWIFWVNVPVALVVMYVAASGMDADGGLTRPAKPLYAETVVVGVAGTALLLALTFAADGELGWLALVAVAVPALYAWRRMPASRTTIDAVRPRTVAHTHLALAASATANAALLFLLPFFTIRELGMTASMARTEPVNARGRRTRTALLDAARHLVEEAGPQSMTMASVADRAGVSRRAVYLHFASQPELVNALFDYVNDVEDIGSALAPTYDAPDAAAALGEYARFLATFVPRILPVSNAIYRAVQHDEGAAAHWATAMRGRRDMCDRLIEGLADEGRLAAPWTIETGSDMLLALISNDVIETLFRDCGWSTDQTADRLGVLFESTFVSRTADSSALRSGSAATATAR